jgi:hypothetical protein
MLFFWNCKEMIFLNVYKGYSNVKTKKLMNRRENSDADFLTDIESIHRMGQGTH